jgi:hypothetical protein
MHSLGALGLVALALTFGCSAASAPVLQPRLPVRILSNEAGTAPRPELLPGDAQPAMSAPRIGAPGGSGAGSRRVAPAQSGNETVGGLPAGAGDGAGCG